MTKREEPGRLCPLDPMDRRRSGGETDADAEEWLLAAYRKLDERGKYRVRNTIAGCLADGGGKS